MPSRRRDLESALEKSCDKVADAAGYDYVKVDKAKKDWPDKLYVGPYGDTFFVIPKIHGIVEGFRMCFFIDYIVYFFANSKKQCWA